MYMTTIWFFSKCHCTLFCKAGYITQSLALADKHSAEPLNVSIFMLLTAYML